MDLVFWANLLIEPVTLFASMIMVCFWIVVLRKVGWKKLGTGSHYIAGIFISLGVGVLMRTYKMTLLDWNMLPVVDRYGDYLDLFTNFVSLIAVSIVLFSLSRTPYNIEDYRLMNRKSDVS